LSTLCIASSQKCQGKCQCCVCMVLNVDREWGMALFSVQILPLALGNSFGTFMFDFDPSLRIHTLFIFCSIPFYSHIPHETCTKYGMEVGGHHILPYYFYMHYRGMSTNSPPSPTPIVHLSELSPLAIYLSYSLMCHF
jgi:hypothetical protein